MTAPPIFDFQAGTRPLLVSIPHDGHYIPPQIADRMTADGRAGIDADWHVRRLYDFAAAMGASVLAANYARYVVDLNRPSDGRALYPGRDETGLCPTSTFDYKPLYLSGREPGGNETEERVRNYWKPYHDKLAAELDRLRESHGSAVLWEAHSIRSQVPRFFDGRLPDFNFGTDSGRTCPDAVVEECHAIAEAAGYTVAVNDRFKGGYTTRHYADPASRLYSIQLELSQITYMDEDQRRFDETRAERIRPLIRQMLERCAVLAEGA